MRAYDSKMFLVDGVPIVLNPVLRRMYVLYGDHVCVYAELPGDGPTPSPFIEVLCNMQADEILRQMRFPLDPPYYVDTPPNLKQAVWKTLEKFLRRLRGEHGKRKSA